MARRVPKILCFPDGDIFCNYHVTEQVCAVYRSDDDTPPAPESLGINMHSECIVDLADLVWLPVRIAVAQVEYIENTAPYDEETGDPA